MTPEQTTIPLGLCQCGCGKPTKIAKYNSPKYGWIKGLPVRFCRGHQGKKPRKDVSGAHGFKINNAYCRLIPLTNDQLTIVEATDYGWLAQWSWYAQRSPDDLRYYAVRQAKDENGKSIKVFMQREILGLKTGNPLIGDHVRPAETLDNTRGNLRIATRVESQCNRLMPRHNSTGFKGVTWNKADQTYHADIVIRGKHINLGTSPTADGASKKYEAGVIQYHGEFANTNKRAKVKGSENE